MERGFVVEAARVHVRAEADELSRGLSGTAVRGYVERRPFAVEFPSVDGEPCAQERDERRGAVLKCRRVDERIAIFVEMMHDVAALRDGAVDARDELFVRSVFKKLAYLAVRPALFFELRARPCRHFPYFLFSSSAAHLFSSFDLCRAAEGGALHRRFLQIIFCFPVY